MLVSQQNGPRSGVQWRMNGRDALLTRKQMFIGPNVAPLLNSWRVQVLQPVTSEMGNVACRLASISCKSSGEACVAELELRNLTCMLTRFPSTLTSVIHNVNPCTSTHGPGEQFSGVGPALFAPG